MSRWRRLLDRIERVLELAEILLRHRADLPIDESFFRDHYAFRWQAEPGGGRLVAIQNPASFDLSDLVGVDRVVSLFRRNIEQFLAHHPFNHVLLYGDRGTGKSSAVKGVLQAYAEHGLCLVEVEKGELVHLPRILACIQASGTPKRFLVFCDDLSFGAGEPGYRELKAALDGSLAGPAENICLVVTSNRRHLVSQSMTDNRQARLDADNELHLGEALEEKLALADRFGLALGFFCFDQTTYLEIVAHYLEKEKSGQPIEGVREAALRWALVRGSRSGRTARQFVNDFVGRERLDAQAFVDGSG